MAVLDTSGELLAYGEGDGRLTAAAVCPGAEKIVEIAEPERAYNIGGADQPRLEIRDVATLAIEESFELDITERDRSQLNGMDWLFDLQCHDADANLITYLLPTGEWDALAGSDLPGPAELHIWRNGSREVVAAGDARAVAVDSHTEVFYAITGIKGTTLDTRDFTGQLINSEDLPDDHVGWRLALSPAGSELAVLARARPMGRENWFFAEVNRLLVIDLLTGQSQSHKLEHKGFANHLERSGDSFLVAVGRWEHGTTEVSRLESGEAVLVGSYPIGDRGLLAVGSDTVIMQGSDGDSDDPIAATRLDLATGAKLPIDGLVASRIAFVLPAGTTITDLPPLTSEPPDDVAPDTTLGGSRSVEGTLPPETIEAETAIEPTDGGFPAIVIGAFGALALLAIGVIVLARRSRFQRS
ncbi:MAG: hypothetical protein GY720_02155 [bacterium]|nr:hypothetical protein [bacterium]